MNALWVTRRQLFEASRLADRCGNAFGQELDSGRLLVLLATGGHARPDLALELDRDGQVVARQHLDLARPDDDELDDLGDERPLALAFDLQPARPAPRCGCEHPMGEHDQARCCRRCAITP